MHEANHLRDCQCQNSLIFLHQCAARSFVSYSTRLKGEDQLVLFRVLAPSGRFGEVTQPSFHLKLSSAYVSVGSERLLPRGG